MYLSIFIVVRVRYSGKSRKNTLQEWMVSILNLSHGWIKWSLSSSVRGGMAERSEASKAILIFPSIPKGLSDLPDYWNPWDNPECMCTYRDTRENAYTRLSGRSIRPSFVYNHIVKRHNHYFTKIYINNALEVYDFSLMIIRFLFKLLFFSDGSDL